MDASRRFRGVENWGQKFGAERRERGGVAGIEMAGIRARGAYAPPPRGSISARVSYDALGSPVVTYVVATLIAAEPFSYDGKEGEGRRRGDPPVERGGWKVIGCVSS